MSKSMLTLTKKVLKGVSFDVQLFYKELEKAYKVLLPHELKELTEWLLQFTQNKPELRQCLVLIN
ncbi:hypothetical protein [Flavobacterium capsici]|uniref:Uncharacterized protein n=1 Tax=Flavobacterium capsici TaxID=3075618 RepID=A0AA96F1B0_9FLAO|nr:MULTISPECIES: hypothetical protein [unclassified Flavobacterium]WNM18004.1 hypothetical protein RN608_08255 [Flavobacterium sp. PMR2A8]WNM22056.1 hypothetical protein RN605_01555 [Flavobacterium sp. PMTSA4]